MIDVIREICRLQTAYSPENTPQMKRRGELIRRSLPAAIRSLDFDLRQALGYHGGDLDVEASDGIGRKTEAPWVRIFSKRRSPSAREGYYIVLHFAADGSALFITIGCGSTIWNGYDLKAISDAELARRTEWARGIVEQRFGGCAPFGDQIVLGARAKLPRTFEKATALAKRISVDELEEEQTREILLAAALRLAAVYEAERLGLYPNSSSFFEAELEALSRPHASIRGQGLGLTAEERRAVELRAMELASKWLLENGFSVSDRSANHSFDILAQRGETVMKIEVKGTTSFSPNSIFMTKNEVDLHRSERGRTGLIIVSQITIRRHEDNCIADGGIVEAMLGWDIMEWEVKAMAYQLSRPLSVADKTQ